MEVADSENKILNSHMPQIQENKGTKMQRPKKVNKWREKLKKQKLLEKRNPELYHALQFCKTVQKNPSHDMSQKLRKKIKACRSLEAKQVLENLMPKYGNIQKAVKSRNKQSNPKSSGTLKTEIQTSKGFRQVEKYPGDAPISTKLLKKYERGDKMRELQARTLHGQKNLIKSEKKLKMAVKQAARSERLLQEEAGFIVAEEGESTTNVTQSDIIQAADITTAQKHFHLDLTQFGPYKMQYTRNGKFLLISGAKGHVAAMDWLTKKLLCEINVMETVHDIKWLHQETMFAVAQKQWTYIYDNQGIELHCLKQMHEALRLEFLPYHFLLASSSASGYLSWIDVSIGQKVAGHSTKLGRLDVMCQNPQNAVLCLGHAGGSVTMWSPNVKEPLVKMLCHGGATRAVTVDSTGNYMATSGVDRKMKVWDIRNFKMLHSYQIGSGAGNMVFSQRGLLGVSKGNIVEVYQDPCRQQVTSPYLIHKLSSIVHGLQFCPYEDVLGVGHGDGFTSLVIPGAGEANFDAMESNPYQTKKQRRQAEVQMLLEKVPAELISLQPGAISQVDVKTFQQKVEENNKLHFMKPMSMTYEPKYKMKGKSKGKKKEQRKRGVIEEKRKETIKEIIQEKKKKKIETKTSGPTHVLDRFKKKDS